jgi:hypothetical protein
MYVGAALLVLIPVHGPRTAIHLWIRRSLTMAGNRNVAMLVNGCLQETPQFDEHRAK